MSTLTPIHTTPAIRFDYLNWIAIDPLARDQTRATGYMSLSIASTRSIP